MFTQQRVKSAAEAHIRWAKANGKDCGHWKCQRHCRQCHLHHARGWRVESVYDDSLRRRLWNIIVRIQYWDYNLRDYNTIWVPWFVAFRQR